MYFTHIINPYAAPAGSEAERTQKITFAALRAALGMAEKHGVTVELVAVGEVRDAAAVEEPARFVPPLTRTVRDLVPLEKPLPFPLIADVLGRGAQHGIGDYVVFTNMDICPQRYFYCALAEMLRGQRDAALVIPRRTIPAAFAGPEELPAMYREKGEPHEGFDCFVFPRSWVERLDLGLLCLGTPDFDLALIMNLEAISGFHTRILWKQFLTFHLGNDQVWAQRSEINGHNHREALAICARLEAAARPLPSRSKFIYAKVWLTHEPPPPASRLEKAWGRARKEWAEWRNRWLVRRSRRAAGLPHW